MLRKAALFGLSLLLFSGCKKEEPPPPPPPPPPPVTQAPPPPPLPPFKVTGTELGKGIKPDKTVQTATDTFGPKDTIYLSVASEGMPQPRAVLAVKWTYGAKDTPVHEETANLTPPSAKPMHTEFHIAKPSGWPAGDYKVALSVDGQPSVTKTFTVSKTTAASGKTR
jgi:hypothetical protein